MSTGLEQFARKQEVVVPQGIMQDMQVMVPPLYYWEDVYKGKSELMTMAFDWKGRIFGMSFPMEDDNAVRIEMNRKKLFKAVKEVLDVLCHHGEKVLDATGNVDIRLVNEQEAIRYKYDEHWDKKVAALNKLVKIKPITRKQAIKLGLLDQPKT